MLTPLKRNSVAGLLKSEDIFATTLLAVILDNYGAAALNWEGYTIEKELHDDFDVILPKINIDKFEALRVAITTDQFFNDPLTFNLCCEALCSEHVSKDHPELVTPEHMAWGITEVVANYDKKDLPKFSDDVRRMIGLSCFNHGLHTFPDVLKIGIPPEKNDLAIASDDISMLDAYATSQKEHTSGVTDYVTHNLHQMINQLNSVHLEHRDVSGWSKFTSKITNT